MNNAGNVFRKMVIGEMNEVLLKDLKSLDPKKKSAVRKLNEVKKVQKFLEKYKSEYIETESRG